MFVDEPNDALGLAGAAGLAEERRELHRGSVRDGRSQSRCIAWKAKWDRSNGLCDDDRCANQLSRLNVAHNGAQGEVIGLSRGQNRRTQDSPVDAIAHSQLQFPQIDAAFDPQHGLLTT